MDDRLTEKALEYLRNIESFVDSEAPEVIQQTLRYKTISTYCGLIFVITGIVVCLSVLFYSFYYPKYDKYDHLELISVLTRIIPISLLILFIGGFLSELDTLMKLYIAPKLFLIEYFTNLRG